MTQRVVLATRNRGKLAELTRILDGLVDVSLETLDTFPGAPEVEETGSTFEENALLKARAIAAYTGLPAVADDSGLCVDFLGGAPGVRSARWAGEPSDDRTNLELVLSQLEDAGEGMRAAHFACAAAAVVPGVGERVVTADVHGTLIHSPRGENGFGYDPIFVPDGYSVTSAELSSEEKDAISHRGKALRALAPLLAELLG